MGSDENSQREKRIGTQGPEVSTLRSKCFATSLSGKTVVFRFMLALSVISNAYPPRSSRRTRKMRAIKEDKQAIKEDK